MRGRHMMGLTARTAVGRVPKVAGSGAIKIIGLLTHPKIARHRSHVRERGDGSTTLASMHGGILRFVS